MNSLAQFCSQKILDVALIKSVPGLTGKSKTQKAIAHSWLYVFLQIKKRIKLLLVFWFFPAEFEVLMSFFVAR